MTRKKETEKKKTASRKKEILQAPKGMRDILNAEYFTYQGFYEKASEISLYYGFRPIETPVLEKEELFLRTVGEHTDIVQKEMYTLRTKGGDRLALRPEGTASVMRAYIEGGMQNMPQPVMLYYYGPFFRHDKPQRGRLRELRQFGLETIGTDKSIADAVIIKVILTILEEAGFENLTVDINSLGDKDTRAAYRRALQQHFRKHASKLSGHARELATKNPLRLMDSKDETVVPFKEEAPGAIDFLTGASKAHFREVLEYLDALETPYRINNQIVRGLDYYSRTVFEILEQREPSADENAAEEDEQKKLGEPLALASGGRYDGLGKVLGAKKDLPGVGAAIGVDRVIQAGGAERLSPRILKKPKVFFIQLGFDAKLKSLKVIEILRSAKLPIKQSLSKDSLGIQLGMAERLGIPWVIILGQKEVIDNTVIIRNMQDRSQKTVSIDNLHAYLKQTVAK